MRSTQTLRRTTVNRTLPLILAASLLVGCNNDNDETDYETQAILDVKAIVATDIGNLKSAAEGIRDSMPTPDVDGWNATDDTSDVTAMREHWHDARVAYERIEGAIVGVEIGRASCRERV